MKKLWSFTGKVLAMSLTFLLSLFIYAHAAEEVFYVDLPYINTVTKTSLPNILSQVKKAKNVTFGNREKFGFFGKPVLLGISKLDFAINLQDVVVQDGQYIANRNVVSTFIFDKSNAGRLGKSVIFSAKNSSLLDAVIALAEGDRITIITDAGWKYSYKVIKRVIIPKDSDYILTDAHPTEIVILKELTNSPNTMIIEAEYINVEEVQK